MQLLARPLLPLLLAAGALAASVPTDGQASTVGLRRRSPNFYERIRDIIGNSTQKRDINERSTVFSTSQDGVDSAGFYYSLYNANGAAVGYTEFSNSGEFEIGWDLTSETEFLGGKGYKSTSTRYAITNNLFPLYLIPTPSRPVFSNPKANRPHNSSSLTWSGYFTATGDYTLAIYGWTLDPVTEWYIVEDHGTGTPGNGDVLGTVTSDGGTYKIYDLYYSDVPEIYGVTSFHQLWSVRESDRTTGTVDVTTHFDAWKSLGLDPGTPIFQMVTLEGFEGDGYLDFTVS